MAKERLKWTIEEEEALFAGVEKHGQGKWKVILTDPQFASILANRSNIDLKDKWRNISVNRERFRTPMSEGVTTKTNLDSPKPLSVVLTSDPRFASILASHSNIDLKDKRRNISVNREKVRTPMSEGEGDTAKTNPPLDSPKPLSSVPRIEYGGTPAPSRSTIDRRIAPDYEAMILEALFDNADPNGVDSDAILSFIQERYELPENFKRSATSMLRRLVLTGELEKVNNHYKIHSGAYSAAEEAAAAAPPLQDDDKEQEATPCNHDDDKQEEDESAAEDSDSDSDSESESSGVAAETIEDATLYAARAVAVAENKDQLAVEAYEEANRFLDLVEESMAMLVLAEHLHEKCEKEGSVLVAL